MSVSEVTLSFVRMPNLDLPKTEGFVILHGKNYAFLNTHTPKYFYLSTINHTILTALSLRDFRFWKCKKFHDSFEYMCLEYI